MKANILIVDDNKSVLSALDILLAPQFDHVKCFSSPNQIVTELRQRDYQLVLLDMNFKTGANTGNEGIFWLNEIKERSPSTSVVLITAYGDVELAVKALKLGATDFILKPWDNAKLLATIQSAIQLSFSRNEVSDLKQKEKALKQAFNPKDKYMIGSSPELMAVLKMVQKVAKTDTNVLITGENGTGKELVAREIHRLSKRNKEMLVSVDMGAVTETLFESELFGHVKGAFTDARESRPGKFEIAHKGTLFLDEIGNLSFHLQAKLLAALQNRQVTRIGANQPMPIDIRLITATNKDLERMVGEELFREDLLYRINTIHIEVPPLRVRGNDILVLAEFFLKKYAHKYDKPVPKLNQQAQEMLLKYQWPGNIRELEHAIEKAIILSDTKVLKPDDFYLRPAKVGKGGAASLKIEDMEQKLIGKALEAHPGNITAAAAELGITRQTLYNKMKKYEFL
ncbi:DNA-binding transcriptional response regulator, NtrC family, contains REC, AAA-type ATPase, and a Fis-type DNA-binding domains [Saccharicrinis carchari]|uniref:DNA-binding transcriptional response regulator, NtrC family, contains REC, AAA-type ATPase, and a Fis-type DNA-binding domains n=1 Tax=Saccharicrinis carchari TaxID=1168039 RepID=A0A521CNB0_SACCC|nr:sigma-54 dependent transcriptional regulator [Saccharicrinis carchari]SMO60932.1 DNA-binding transcriptional response regulator, NtrC family, contains REC, AAA-type ATPase, and a Fis-type DNA-binding domains [Saccharicrinis carchari]